MDMKDAKIFSPLTVGRTVLKNRVGMAPMSMDYEAKDGTVPKRLADIFVRRAEGGTGFVVIDAVTIDRKYQYIGNTTCLDSDDLIPQFKAFADRVSAAGSTLIPQIIHPGPESICGFRGIAPMGPSVNTNANCHVSRAMSIDEIQAVIKQYGEAARRVEAAGCGGIGLHCAHAYMMPGAFLSPLRNKRMDEYGAIVKSLAKEHDAILVDLQAAFDKVLQHMHPMALAWDRIHPDQVGHMVMTLALLRALGAAV
jgi:NAD(H)-dependent 7beta-hydroxy-3-oxo-delta4-cholenoic acid oxidoreductase